MRLQTDDAIAAYLRRTFGAFTRVLGSRALAGGTSSQVHRVSVDAGGDGGDGGAVDYVLRIHTKTAWLMREPDLIAHEAAALDYARSLGVAAPQCIDQCDAWAGFAGPALLMSHVPGEVIAAPDQIEACIRPLARWLADFHAVRPFPPASFPWQFRSWVPEGALYQPVWFPDAQRWTAAMNRWQAGARPFARTFIHRDFHPMNVLWQRGAVSGVVDWVNACIGPADVDVAVCRRNLAMLAGVEAAETFRIAYESFRPGHQYDFYWDLNALFDAALPEPKFYPPWSDFGVAHISRDQLHARAAALLTVAVTSA